MYDNQSLNMYYDAIQWLKICAPFKWFPYFFDREEYLTLVFSVKLNHSAFVPVIPLICTDVVS